jgi:hypothetical protein
LTIASILGALLVTPIIGSLRLFAKCLLSKITLREPFPDEETPTEQAGFFSQVLCVKESGVPPQTKRKQIWRPCRRYGAFIYVFDWREIMRVCSWISARNVWE